MELVCPEATSVYCQNKIQCKKKKKKNNPFSLSTKEILLFEWPSLFHEEVI